MKNNIEGMCVYCGGEVFNDGKEPYELWYPTNRVKQTIEKGIVHRACFLRAFDKFNALMDERGQLKNHQLFKEITFFAGVGDAAIITGGEQNGIKTKTD